MKQNLFGVLGAYLAIGLIRASVEVYGVLGKWEYENYQ